MRPQVQGNRPTYDENAAYLVSSILIGKLGVKHGSKVYRELERWACEKVPRTPAVEAVYRRMLRRMRQHNLLVERQKPKLRTWRYTGDDGQTWLCEAASDRQPFDGVPEKTQIVSGSPVVTKEAIQAVEVMRSMLGHALDGIDVLEGGMLLVVTHKGVRHATRVGSNSTIEELRQRAMLLGSTLGIDCVWPEGPSEVDPEADTAVTEPPEPNGL
ncbi:MAG: hypothetical protein AAF721_00360 [Myxococcota bacterium]